MTKTNKTAVSDLNIQDIPMGLIDIHPINDRKDLDDSELQGLADSIVRDGQLTPCLARPLPNGRYQLIFGSRRYHASKLANAKTLRLDIRDVDDQNAIEMIGVENIHRRDFNPIELAQYIDRLLTPVEEGGAGLTTEYVAERFGKKASWARTARRLLKLPEFWQDLVARGRVVPSIAIFLVPHVKYEPVMKAVEASYRKNPEAWKHQDAFTDQLAFIVHRFEKLQKASPGPIGGPNGRMVTSNRIAALSPPTVRDAYEEERIERQTDILTQDLDAITEGVEAMPHVPLSAEQAEALLAKHWDDGDALRLIRRFCNKRISELASDDSSE